MTILSHYNSTLFHLSYFKTYLQIRFLYLLSQKENFIPASPSKSQRYSPYYETKILLSKPSTREKIVTKTKCLWWWRKRLLIECTKIVNKWKILRRIREKRGDTETQRNDKYGRSGNDLGWDSKRKINWNSNLNQILDRTENHLILPFLIVSGRNDSEISQK